ncbi:MAG: metal-dependent transcriptional regulator [Chitinophagaceae bacterium]|nr:metal-dependent transcriptional regulator [Chitinophagaceae bacterium]
MDLSKNEEDYLKALFYLLEKNEGDKIGNNQLAAYLNVSPASANNMLKKLKLKNLVQYEKYGKIEVTALGLRKAVFLVRKHRLWETFLHLTLNFNDEEVHEVAEQLEHIKSEKLIIELEKFLKFPSKDPHGETIPDISGKYLFSKQQFKK